MRGIDQLTNIIIEDCHERVYTSSGVSTVELGVYLARGDNMYAIDPAGEHRPLPYDTHSMLLLLLLLLLRG